MTEHTLGPWELEANGTAYNLRSPDRVEHFAILLGMVHNNEGELEANARLIAAAPELLEALEELEARYPSNVGMNKARAAIRKARELGG